MEFTFNVSQIAGLVLGYLKENKFVLTAEEFIKECSLFKERSRNPKMIRKYSFTRHFYSDGTRLVDFLYEYAAIYTIVQSSLESGDVDHDLPAKSTLVEKLIYLLDKELPGATTSTPHLRQTNEVDTTPSSSLPGNTLDTEENSQSKTPKRRTRSKSKEVSIIEDFRDVSDVFTRSFLEKTELHERIADTINSVRSGPDSTRADEAPISSGAAKEFEAIIKSAVKSIEEDPIYNEVIDEIIGGSETEKQQQATVAESSGTESGKDKDGIIEDHNNEAVRSIMAATLTSSSKPIENSEGGGVYVFDNTLDSYLKTGTVTSVPSIPSNPLYINTTTGGLIVVPEPAPQQFYIVNNQPLLNVVPTVPTVSTVSHTISDADIMSMPIIMNNDTVKAPIPKKSTVRKIAAKPVTVSNNKKNPEKPKANPSTHVRNLDFSNLAKDETEITSNSNEKPKQQKEKVAWDSELRILTSNCVDRSPTPKRRKNVGTRKKNKTSTEENQDTLEEIEVPKTPGLEDTGKMFNTPFARIIEQLDEADIQSVTTPQVPLTPGFGLTPNEGSCNKRATDYSTSSSYYQPPSDTEQNHSIEQLLEECNKMEKEKRISVISDETNKKMDDRKTNFDKKIIGKKNLNLLNREPTLSSSDDSDDDIDLGELAQKLNKTSTESQINEILQTVDVKNTLEDSKSEETKLLSHLEIVRQRTVENIKNAPQRPKRSRAAKKTAKAPASKIKKSPQRKTSKTNKRTYPKKKKEKVEEEEKSKGSDEADKLVKGLADWGIHLVPNKTPTIIEEFNRKLNSTFEIVKHDEANPRYFHFDLEYLKKRFKAEVYLKEADDFLVRIIHTTEFCELLEIPTKIPTSPETPIDDELMDLALSMDKSGSESPGKITSRGGRKRKSRLSEDEKRQPEKKNKTHESNLKLLKNIDVDDFLDKVHKT